MTVNQLRKKFTAIINSIESSIEKLEDLIEDFNDDELFELTEPFMDQLTQLIIDGDKCSVSAPAILEFIENELTEKKDDN